MSWRLWPIEGAEALWKKQHDIDREEKMEVGGRGVMLWRRTKQRLREEGMTQNGKN